MSSSKIWALSDLHLPSTRNQTMDKFSTDTISWVNHPQRLMEQFQQLFSPNDLLLVSGDISAAHNIKEAEPDFEYLEQIPCTVIMSEGNHESWSNKYNQVIQALPKNCVWTVKGCHRFGNVAIISQRLWDIEGVFPWPGHFPQKRGNAQEIIKKELHSLETKLKLLPQDQDIIRIVMVHFPPISFDAQPNDVTRMFSQYNINFCIYGHVHGQVQKVPAGDCTIDGVRYILASCDYINFIPVQISEFQNSKPPISDNPPVSNSYLSLSKKYVNFAFSKEVPNIQTFSEAISIDLLKTRIRSIKIESFSNLLRFRASHVNNLHTVDIKNCPNLSVIDISECNISNLSLENLPALRCVNAAVNQIKTFDFQLPSLETLILSKNPISTLDPTLFPNILNLSISSTKIQDLSFITQFTHLERLKCSGNDIDFNIFSSHPSLRSLYISESTLQNVTSSGNLKRFLYNGPTDISLLTCPYYIKHSKIFHLPPEFLPTRRECSWVESERLLYGPWGIPPIDNDLPVTVSPYTGPPIDNGITNDRIMGAVFGSALGDCLGASMEFKSTPEALFHLETPLDITWNMLTPLLFYRGCCTDDTDQAVIIMRSLVSGQPNFKIFAKELIKWVKSGESEHLHDGCYDCGNTTYHASIAPGFKDDPIQAVSQNPPVPANGSTMRTAPVGCFKFWDENEVIKNAANFSKCTHHDVKAIFGAILVSLLISRYIQKANGLINELDIDDTIEIAIKEANAEKDRNEIMLHCNVDDLEPILNDTHSGYVLKAIAATIFSLRKNLSYTEAMEQIIEKGHDADTNAAIVGGVLGAKYGFNNIPKDLMKYLYSGNWIYKDLAKMMAAMGIQPVESPFHVLSFE